MSAIRYLFRCSAEACGHVWGFDYEDRSPFDPRRPFIKPNGDAITTTPAMDKIRGCPICKASKPTMGRVRGKFSPDHKCDERCTEAKGTSCTCACGGANHGRAFIKEGVTP